MRPLDPTLTAKLRGWGASHGNPTADAPRNGCLWNDYEDGDLAAAHLQLEMAKQDIAKHHGRTYISIEMRLTALGLTDPADDFRDDPLPEEPTKENAMLKMTTNRLMALLAIHRGTYSNELKVSTSAADLAFLHAAGLVDARGRGLTGEGADLVGGLLEQGSSKSRAVGTAWDKDRETSALDNQRFFLVVSGDCHKEGGGPKHDLPQLKNPPRVVQPSARAADQEAVRLATANPGAKFFVMQAVSVHQATTPVASLSL